MHNYKKEQRRKAEEIEKTRYILKQLLYALHVSEGFGENRLLRVLLEWAETQKIVQSANKSEANDALLMIDSVLNKVLPSQFVEKTLGKEPLRDWKGKEIK